MIMSILTTGNAGYLQEDSPVNDETADTSAAVPEPEPDEVVHTGGTRQATSVVVNGGTETYTGEHTFYNFFAFNGSTIKFQDATITVKTSDPFLDVDANFNVTGETTTLEIVNSVINCEWGTFKADCKNITSCGVYGNNRRFCEKNTFSSYTHKSVCSAKVYADICGKNASKTTEVFS